MLLVGALILNGSILLSSCTAPPQKGEPEFNILFMGDTAFGENYQEKLPVNILEKRGYKYGFERYSPLLKQADLTISNLETPLLIPDAADVPLKKTYIHHSRPELSADIFNKYGLHVFSLANNHILDYGESGLKKTLAALEEYKIESFGAGPNREEAERPFTTILPNGKKLLVFGAFEYDKTYDREYRFYAEEKKFGVARLNKKSTAERIRAARIDNPDAFIVVFPHWGQNYRPVKPNQTVIGYALIDAGADLIVGHGAHILQAAEEYHGKHIYYNLGNFVFNSPGRYQKEGVAPFSAILRLTFSKKSVRLRLYPIVTDNLVTAYQGHFVAADEVEKPENQNFGTAGSDEYGLFFETNHPLGASE